MTDAQAAGVTTVASPRDVAGTVERLRGVAEARHLTVFLVLDQAAAARAVGLALRDTVLVLLGSPRAGTPVMAADPLAAVDLPLRVVVWDDGGTTKVSYVAPRALAARYHLPEPLRGAFDGLDALVAATVAA